MLLQQHSENISTTTLISLIYINNPQEITFTYDKHAAYYF